MIFIIVKAIKYNVINKTQYSKEDAGYTPTDFALRFVLRKNDCSWISITNADNLYGSNVFENILKESKSIQYPQPDMILASLDSRNFAEQGSNPFEYIDHIYLFDYTIIIQIIHFEKIRCLALIMMKDAWASSHFFICTVVWLIPLSRPQN